MNAVRVQYQCPWGGVGWREVVREPGLSMRGQRARGAACMGDPCRVFREEGKWRLEE